MNQRSPIETGEQQKFNLKKAISAARYWVNLSNAQAIQAKSETEKKAKIKQVGKFEGIVRILESLGESSLQTPEALAALLDKDLDEMDGVRKSESQRFDEMGMEADYEATFATIEFVRTLNGTLDSPAFKKWESAQNSPPAPKEQQQPKPAVDEKQNLENRKRELDEIWRKSQEKQKGSTQPSPSSTLEHQREKIAEIVLKEGGIRVHTSIPNSISFKGYAGFQSLETRIQDGRQPHGAISAIEYSLLTAQEARQGKRPDYILEEHGIREIIHIRQDQKPVYETVTIPGSKGVLGIGKTPDKVERRDTGRYEPALHRELVSGGKNEPAVRFVYFVNHSDDWRDYSGRSGQILVAEIVLPASSAKEVEQVLNSDPAAIRKVVERVMKEKLLKDPAAWEKPDNSRASSLRPPYEKWDAEPNGGRIYIQKEGEEPGFHEKNLRKVR